MILFLAESEEELLQQIRQVSLEEDCENQRRLEEAETPRRLLHRLHRDPLGAMRDLASSTPCAELPWRRPPDHRNRVMFSQSEGYAAKRRYI